MAFTEDARFSTRGLRAKFRAAHTERVKPRVKTREEKERGE